MHQTLRGLPLRVIVDANVLLNGAFVSGSSASYSIAQLRSLGYSPVIDEAIEKEAILRLDRLRMQHALSYEPADCLGAFLSQNQIVVLPRAPLLSIEKINRADRKIYSAAVHYAAWILTGDIRLARQCHSISFPVRLPWDVIVEAAIQNGNDPPLEYVLRWIGVSRTEGSIFARVIPGTWAGMRAVGRFTVCDVENVGRLLYDTDAGNWKFMTAFGEVLRTPPCSLAADQQWIVCVSYEFSAAGIGSITLRAASLAGEAVDCSVQTKNGISAATPGSVSFGHSVKGEDHWNGCIQKIVISPKTINDAWKAFRAVPEAAPDPMAGNILEAALQKVRFTNGRFVLPSERELRRVWV